ncbi:hypothetical protein GCM10010381_54830 [Streptomyces xantholiticus]|nr:hypothetical protein GCM10010381_54830 [Streptomyces xantholiticus]
MLLKEGTTRKLCFRALFHPLRKRRSPGAHSIDSDVLKRGHHLLTAFRQRFGDWRGSRPFWGGLLTMLGGVPIVYLPYAALTLDTLAIRIATTAGSGSLVIGVLLVALGMIMWFQSHLRVFAGVAATVLALLSIPMSNLGGLLIGLLLALLGGTLSIAWTPGRSAPTA